MLLSMTGFGKSVVTIPNKKITVEIKSLNSKQLDISARVPAIF
ncbi:YicC/YloC family endoribonuclease, partial [uncultured Muribaculum sp.]